LSRELRLCTRRKPPCNPRDFTQEGPSMLSNIVDLLRRRWAFATGDAWRVCTAMTSTGGDTRATLGLRLTPDVVRVPPLYNARIGRRRRTGVQAPAGASGVGERPCLGTSFRTLALKLPRPTRTS